MAVLVRCFFPAHLFVLYRPPLIYSPQQGYCGTAVVYFYHLYNRLPVLQLGLRLRSGSCEVRLNDLQQHLRVHTLHLVAHDCSHTTHLFRLVTSDLLHVLTTPTHS